MGAELTAEIKAALDASDAKITEELKKCHQQIADYGKASESITAQLKAMGAESEDLKKAYDKQIKAMQDELTAVMQKGTKMSRTEEVKSIGRQVTESEEFKSYLEGSREKFRFEFKNTIIGEGGSPQNPVDTIVPRDDKPGIIAGAFRSLRLLEVIPQGTTTSNTVHYTRELAWTNNAAETPEGTQKPESSLTFEPVDCPVRTIAHFIKVSKQVLDDAPQLESYIDRRMRYGVQYRLENQIINGPGGQNLSGMLQSGNSTLLAAESGNNGFDVANRMKYAIINGEYMADYFLINPLDWGAMERLKVSATDERYVGQAGPVSYLANGLIPMLWGVPVIASNTVPQGTLIGFSAEAMTYWSRQGTTVEIFDQNQDDVEKNLLTIRAELRGAFCVHRPSAVYRAVLPT